MESLRENRWRDRERKREMKRQKIEREKLEEKEIRGRCGFDGEREREERERYILLFRPFVSVYMRSLTCQLSFYLLRFYFPVNPGPPAMSPITWEEKKVDVLSKEYGWCIW